MTLTQVNKPINLYYFYSCIHILLFFFWAGSSSAHRGWAGPSGPARSLAQASDPAGPIFFLPAGMRELLTHACYKNMIIKMKGEGNAAYLLLYLKMW